MQYGILMKPSNIALNFQIKQFDFKMKHSSASTDVTDSSGKSFRIYRPEIIPRTKEVLNILVEADSLFVFKGKLMQI